MEFSERKSYTDPDEFEFTDSRNQDISYKVEATSIETLEEIIPRVFPYTKIVMQW